MGKYSKYKNLKNLCANDFIISGCQLLSIMQSAIIKGMTLSEDEKKMTAWELSFKMLKSYDLEEMDK